MNKKRRKILIGSLLLIIIVCFLTLVLSRAGKKDNNTTTTTTTATTTAKKEDMSEEELKRYILLSKIMNLIDAGKAFDTGDYVRGDIPKGEYAIVSLSDGSKYYEEEDSSGNIIDNENFDSFGYVMVHAKGDITTRGVLISVNSFDELGVTCAKEIYEILNNQKDYNESGFYKVGYDIPAGNYILQSYGSAYFAVLSGPVGKNDIVRNDNFNGKKSVTVNNGQYLEVSRAEIVKK